MFKHKFKYLDEATDDGQASGDGTTDVTLTDESKPGETVESTTIVDDKSTEIVDDKSKDTELTDDKVADTVPETYEKFEMPKGMEVDQTMVDAFSPMMKDLKMDQKSAQEFVDKMAEQVKHQEQLQVEQFNQQSEDWMKQAKADKEYGGDLYDESISHAVRAVEDFGTPELKEMLNNYGIGNHPEMIRMLVKVGKATAEDNPGNNGNSPSETKDHVSILYPKS